MQVKDGAVSANRATDANNCPATAIEAGSSPSPSALADWLDAHGLAAYRDTFVTQDVGLDVLLELSEDDLKELGLPLGARRRFLKAQANSALQWSETSAQGPAENFLEPKVPGTSDPKSRSAAATDPSPDAPTSPAAGAERRQITVMFCDLVGSTALSSRYDPEHLADLMRAFHATCRHEVVGLGGYVARHMGDGVLAYFGYPVADENDAERAIRAGLGLVEAVSQLAGPGGESMACRVGISSGSVIVGERIGVGESEERTVVGQAPNLASRLQSLAEPHEVVVGPLTWRLAGDRFEGTALPPQTLKGIDETVVPWRVRPGRPVTAWRVPARTTPLVGREEELALLTRRWHQARTGAGQVVVLSGEAGVGKSRLIQELTRAVTASRDVWVAQASPLHYNDALHPIREALANELRLATPSVGGPGDPALAALVHHVGQHDLSPSVASGLATVLGIRAETHYPPLLLEGPALARRILALLGEYLERRARSEPRLLVVEDLHWADDATLALLTEWIRRVRSLPVMLVVSARPEWGDRWTDEIGITRLGLQQLTHAEATQLVLEVAGEHALAPGLVEKIVARADGLPLFVEETARNVLEAGDDEVDVPSTLRDSLTARLDRLSVGKSVAQRAAVIGREFPQRVLAEVLAGDETALRRGLDELLAAGLVHPAPGVDGQYVFKHALVRDAAYESVLLRERRILHAQVAEALGEQAPAEVLAEHWSAAEIWAPALRQWYRAIDETERAASFDDAVALVARARAVFARIPPESELDRLKVEIDCLHTTVLNTTRSWGHPDVLAAAGVALHGARSLGEPELQIRALMFHVIHHAVRAEPEPSLTYAREMLSLSRGPVNEAARAQAVSAMGVAHHHAGHLTEAGEFIGQARQLMPQAMGMRKYEIWHLLQVGRLDRALVLAQERLAMAEATGRPLEISDALWTLADTYATRAEAAELLAVADRIGALDEEYDLGPFLRGLGLEHRARALTLLNRAEEALPVAREATETLRTAQSHARALNCQAMWVQALNDAGRQREAEALVLDGLRRGEALGSATVDWIPKLSAAITLYRFGGETTCLPGDALTYLEELHADLEPDVPMRRALAVALAYARALRDRQRRAQALSVLESVYANYTEGFETPRLREAKALMDELTL